MSKAGLNEDYELDYEVGCYEIAYKCTSKDDVN